MKSTRPDRGEIRRIIVFRTDRIGEVVLATAVVEALKRHFPDSNINFVTSSLSYGLLIRRPDIDDVMIFDTMKDKPSLAKAVRFGIGLRSKRFDIALILNPHKALHIAAFVAGIPVRIGFKRKWPFLLTGGMPDKRNEGAKHEVDYNIGLLECIGIKDRSAKPSIFVYKDEVDYVSILLKRQGLDESEKLVVIQPGSSNPAKVWPAENFAELIKLLRKAGHLNIVIIGDESERRACEDIASMSGDEKVINLAGSVDIRHLAALLKNAALLISNDTGPMHIAAALGTKVIAVFGRNIPGVSPRRWGPFGEGHIVFHKDPGCDPCLDRDCPYDFKCLRSITPEEVFKAAERILK